MLWDTYRRVIEVDTQVASISSQIRLLQRLIPLLDLDFRLEVAPTHVANLTESYWKLKICCMQEDVRKLQAIRNSYVPIATLPPEVLCEAFLFVQEQVSWMVLLYLSQVSQNWRRVAFSCPRLWVSLIASPPMRSFLFPDYLRHNSQPLVLNAKISGPDDLQFFRLAKGRCMRQLSIHSVVPWKGTKSWLDFIPSDLQSLRLECDECHSLCEKGRGLRLRPNLSRMTSLQCLSLHHHEATWLSPPLTNLHTLTTLHIKKPVDKVTPQTILASLVEMPRLQLLDLDGVLSRNEVEQSCYLMKRVHLPCLKDLTVVNDQLSHTLELLSGLIFKPGHLTFRVSVDTHGNRAFKRLLQVLNPCCGFGGNDYGLIPTSITCIGSFDKFQCVISGPDSDTPPRRPTWDITLYSNQQKGRISGVLRALHNLPVQALESLTTSIGTSTEIWAQHFGRLPNLKEVLLPASARLTLLNCLNNSDTMCTTKRKGGKVLMPALRKLWIPITSLEREDPMILRWRDLVKARKEAGVGLHALHLIPLVEEENLMPTDQSEALVESLKEIVPIVNIVWHV
ncbi:hypothetical protein BDN72DRAFT_903250 [Pluteus cervinus]|uniref:Uncharacterized protein n=1 Tax=Pluteus cervinus TaxID=181527 RepID=A0ACD3AAJ9_9AGAR|nr:hypothetical protein BDN72DRAFT_903250 [Pluteus cervinus]